MIDAGSAEQAPLREDPLLDVARLAPYLARAVPRLGRIHEVRRYPHGFSNLTFLLHCEQGDAVLRRPPPGASAAGGHDMRREFTMLTALEPTFGRVPRPLHYCDDATILGVPFFVMERVDGLILRGEVPPPLQAPDRMRAACHALVGTLAELHALDADLPGLAGLGRPDGYTRRQVEGWAARFQHARTDPQPAMEATARWLADRIPESDAAAVVHNDFKYDNIVYDPSDPAEVRAVLDWEMATIGHPWMDLGTTLAYWTESGDSPELGQFTVTGAPGNLRREEVVERYQATTRREVDDPVFYYAFGLFKVGVICQQIFRRYREGYTHDARFAGLDAVVRACGDTAQREIALRRISDLNT